MKPCVFSGLPSVENLNCFDNKKIMRYRTRRLPNHCVWKIAILFLSLSLFLSFSFIFLHIDFLQFLPRFNATNVTKGLCSFGKWKRVGKRCSKSMQVDRSRCGWNERDLIGSFEIQFGEPRWKLDEIIRSKTVTPLERSRLPINASPQYCNCERAVFPREPRRKSMTYVRGGQ